MAREEEESSVSGPGAGGAGAGPAKRKTGARKGSRPHGGRAGGKNTQAIDELQKQIEQCVKVDRFQKLETDYNKSLTTISVFNSKMKTFERLYLTKKNEDEISQTEQKISGQLDDVFKPPPTKPGQPKDLAKQQHTIELLTDSKIAGIKGILAQMAD